MVVRSCVQVALGLKAVDAVHRIGHVEQQVAQEHAVHLVVSGALLVHVAQRPVLEPLAGHAERSELQPVGEREQQTVLPASVVVAMLGHGVGVDGLEGTLEQRDRGAVAARPRTGASLLDGAAVGPGLADRCERAVLERADGPRAVEASAADLVVVAV